MSDYLEDLVARAIMLKIQLRDFGRLEENGDFTTTAAQIEILKEACKEAARSAIDVMQENWASTLLNERDDFIIKIGKWSEFVDSLHPKEKLQK